MLWIDAENKVFSEEPSRLLVEKQENSILKNTKKPKAEIVSLLMTEEEENLFSGNSERKNKPFEKKSEPIKAANTSSITVQAILFHEKDKWTVWIDGKSYTPEQTKLPNGLKIKALNGQSIEVTDGSKTSLLFTGQSYEG